MDSKTENRPSITKIIKQELSQQGISLTTEQILNVICKHEEKFFKTVMKGLR